MVEHLFPPLFLYHHFCQNHEKKSFKFLISCLLAFTVTSSAFASVTIIGTRVIYPATEKEVTVRLDNHGNQPALVQAWIDNGNPDEALDK